MKNNVKRVIAFVIVVLMMIIITACNQKPGTPALSDGESKGSTSEAGQSNDYSEHYTFTIASVQVNEATDYNGDEFSKWWLNNFNFEWDVIAMNFDNWEERVRIWISSGDMPDITIFNYKHGEIMNYIEQELIFRFPDNWKERWPNVAKAQKLSELGDVVAEHVGGTYFLARPNFSNNKPTVKNLTNMIVYIRKDWAQAVGFELKEHYTIPEFLEYARLVKEKDPGNVGDRLVPIGVNASNATSLFVRNSSTHTGSDAYFFRGEDGDFYWGPAHDDTLKGLKYYKTAYEEGLLHPEFFSYSGSQDIEDFYVTGVSGAMWYQGMARYMEMLDSNMKENLGLSFDEAVWPCFVTDDEGVFINHPSTNFWGTILFSPNMGMKKWERYMDMLDYSASDEGQLFIRMGFEGVDWEYDEEGNIKTLLPAGIDARNKYPSIYPIYHQLIVLSDDFSLVNPNYRKEFREKTIQLYKLKEALSTDTSAPPMDWDIYLYDSEAKNALSFDFSKDFATLVVSRDDIETAWRNWVESNAYMVDPVLEEFRANLR
jgi:putative aldouronate transport system substrate-binding protein